MNIRETEAKINSRVWKAIARAEIDVSGLSKEALEDLIALVTEAALYEVDQEFDAHEKNSGVSAFSKDDAHAGEQVLWEGRPFLSITTHYRITNERIRITEGLLGKERIDIELVKIQDINQAQRLRERLLNIGDLTIESHDRTHPRVVLENVSDVQRVHEILRGAMIAARRDANFSYREEM